jgi:tetratricopeptide (TPR) repeat protein
VEVAKHNGQNEAAGLCLLNLALREAEVGNHTEGREQVASALALASSKDIETLAALALARLGDTARSQSKADSLGKSLPSNTLLQGYWLPVIRAAIELNRRHPAKAIELLKTGLKLRPVRRGEPLYGVCTRRGLP